jgi:hypothetical protein
MSWRYDKPSQYTAIVDESVWLPGQSESFSQALLRYGRVPSSPYDAKVDVIQLDPHVVSQSLHSNGDEARKSHETAFANLLLYLETNATLEMARVVCSFATHSLIGNADYLLDKKQEYC